MTGQRIGGPVHMSPERRYAVAVERRIRELEAQVRELREAVERLRRDDPNPDEV